MLALERQPLTIGMATFDDFDGAYFTITSLLLHHSEVMDRCRILVVDNHPSSRHGRHMREWLRGHVPNARYIRFTGPRGTAQARNEIFQQAQTDAVLCLDCHVLLAPESVRKLIDYYRSHPACCDLLSGPLLHDSGRIAATHQRPQWSQGAWGVWAKDPRGDDINGEPFEIWQQGMGLFSCRKEAWVGFHPEFRGFGGCESYIMENFANAVAASCAALGYGGRIASGAPRACRTQLAVRTRGGTTSSVFVSSGSTPGPLKNILALWPGAASRSRPRRSNRP